MLWTIIAIAFRATGANLLRALLTMLGIMVGVASVITLIAYSAGQQKEMLKIFDRFGATRLTAEIAFWRHDIPAGEALTAEDADAIGDQLWTIQAVTIMSSGSGQARYGSRTKDETVISATRAAAFEVFDDVKIAEGRPFTAEEDAGCAQVCLLGAQTKYDLFFYEPALGSQIYANGQLFEVIGVLEERNDGFSSIDDSIYIPYNTGQALMPDFFWDQQVTMRVKDYKYMAYAEQQVRELLYLRHPHLEVPDRSDPEYNKDDEPIGIMSVYEAREQRQAAAKSLSRFLVVMGALALMIGAIGVMNIMLVSVEERTNEIGLRKALGASSPTVLGQFLAEAILICSIGGAVGTFAAITACHWIARLPDDLKVPDPILTPAAILTAVLVTAFVGVAAGMYPAINAAALNPIEALRHE
jgi:putative ABC transport system permease protein